MPALARTFVKIVAFYALGLLAILLILICSGSAPVSPAWSISHYVGSTAWSAILFFILNLAASFFFIRIWLKYRSKKQTKLFADAGIIFVIFFLLLSAFPVGLFDSKWGQFGTVSTLHQTFADSLFAVMIVQAIIGIVAFKKPKNLRIYFITFLIFAASILSVVAFARNFFYDYIFIFESGAVVAYLLLIYKVLASKA